MNELGSASVPFPFDVHSMIFSDDAVSLETKLHHILNDQRVNKVNLRKEFFRVSLDDLEKLVGEIAPTADFKRTVLAEQYRQSLSISPMWQRIRMQAKRRTMKRMRCNKRQRFRYVKFEKHLANITYK